MKSFVDVYNTIPKEKIENLERLRKKDLKVSKLELFLLIFFILATLINFFIGVGVVFFEVIIIFATYIISRMYSYSSFRKDYEKDIIKPIVESYSDEIIYDIDGEITEKEYSDTGYSSGDEFYSGNYFETKDKKIRASKISVVSNSTDKDGHESSTILFSGIFGIINLDNYAKESITMKSDCKIRDLLCYNKRKLEVDSAQFEENFDLFSENRVYAMEVFTSEILSSIIKLAENDETKYDFILKENKLYVRYYKKNIFDTQLKDKIDMRKVEKLYDDVYKLLDLLTTLQKNIDEKLEVLENNLKLDK